MSRPESQQSSHASAKSSGTKCLDIVEKGPVMVNGVVFQKIRRCPLCKLTNKDDSPMAGEDGLIVWQDGTNQNPKSRTDKIFWIAFTVGGFADEYGDLDSFLIERKKSPMIMSEWTAARESLLESPDTMPERLGKKVQEKMQSTLKTARTKTVRAFKKSQRRVSSRYRAILRSKFEK